MDDHPPLLSLDNSPPGTVPVACLPYRFSVLRTTRCVFRRRYNEAMYIRLAAFAALCLIPAALEAQEGCTGATFYSPCELTFDLAEQDAAAHPTPYNTVDLRVEFRSPRRRTLAMPAFWDGGRRLVVRFSPTESGQWDYHVTSNIAAWNDKTGSFAVAAGDSKGFIRTANTHHWSYTEKIDGLDQAHLWAGVTEPKFAATDDAVFHTAVDARAAQKFTHIRGAIGAPGGVPDPAFFQRLDGRVRYINQKGMVADLVLASDPDAIAKAFPGAEDRRRYLRYLVARFSAFHVTWQGVGQFEESANGRAVLREIGGYLKQYDPYLHPRTSGARLTSTPLLDDGWMDFAAQGSSDDQLGAIEHQLYAVPFVSLNVGGGEAGADTLRKRLWNTTMNGQSPSFTAGADPGQAFTVWFDLLSRTRYWELEPYFDVYGARAVALEDVEYLVYMEKPGPIELTVEKHGYEYYWINPSNGESTPKKKYSGEHFTGEPPDRTHDWILHVVREGRVESMNRSFKFESRRIVLQEIESNSPKVPFAIEQPTGDIALSRLPAYAVKLTRESRATRNMMYLWVGDVAAGGQGRRILGTGAAGTLQVPPSITRDYPAIMHLRVYGMNANGKVYELDAAHGISR